MRSSPLSASIRHALALAAASTLAIAGSVTAQDTDTGTDRDGNPRLDPVEVTGSRLKRADVEGALPVVVIDRAQIDASGDISVAEVLRDATLASFGNFRPQSGSGAQSLATVDLRGLGSGRTLVLIDGHRAPTNPMFASGGADLNAIPLAAVERIEILSDGASAVYGSDAIGGVVNIILRRDFNGAELRYGVGNTDVTGGDLEDMSAVFGVSSDRTTLVGGASKSSRGMVFTRDQIGGDAVGVSQYGNNYYNWNTGGASAVPGFACDEGAFYLLGNGLCSFNFNLVGANDASVDNSAVFVRGEHAINDDWSVYFAANTTQVESFGRYAPTPGRVRVDDGTPNDINFGTMCGPGGCAPGTTDGLSTYFYHRFAAAGNRDNVTHAQNADYLLGFQGQLSDTIDVDFGMRRTDYRYLETGRGYIVGSLAAQAANSGDYLFDDPFGASQQTLDSFTVTTSRESRWQTAEFYGLMRFDLWQMGGGAASAVVGGEYREDQYHDTPDSLSQAGVVLGTAGGPAGGDRDATAAYFELLLPFASRFDVTLAGRWDDYSDYGDDFSPKVALRWQPFDALTLRGSWGQGFRAPPLDILTQGESFSAEPVTDPRTCAALFQPLNCSTPVDTYTYATPDLDSEHSDQWSVGAVYDPFEWLSLSLDYYAIEIDDQLTACSAQCVVNSDLRPDVFGPIHPGMSIERAPNGRIIRIVAGPFNRGTLETDGIDLRFATDFEFGRFGALRSELAVSYLLNYEVALTDETRTDHLDSDFFGGPIEGAPQTRAQLRNDWAVGDFTFTWNVNYIGENGFLGSYSTNDVQLSWSAPWNATVAIGATNAGNRYPVLDAHDGRPWNFDLYDAYGRTTYLRYTQRF